MIASIAYYQFLGIPLVMYGGIFTLLLLLTAATIGYLMNKGIVVIPIKIHKLFAGLGIIFAFAHAGLGMLAYFGY